MDRGGGAPSADAHVHRAALGEGRRARGGVRAREPVRHHPGAAAQDPLRPASTRCCRANCSSAARWWPGEYDTKAPWFAHNRALIKEIEDLEHKARKSGVWLDEERIFRVFDARIPADLHNGAAFEKWRTEAEAANPKILFLQREDILGEGARRRPHAVPRDDGGRRRGVQAQVPLRARPRARRRDAAPAAVPAQPHRAGAGRLAGARPHPRKTHRTAEISAQGQAPPVDSAARYGDGVSLGGEAGRADTDRRAGGLHPQEDRRRHPSRRVEGRTAGAPEDERERDRRQRAGTRQRPRSRRAAPAARAAPRASPTAAAPRTANSSAPASSNGISATCRSR